MASEDSSMGGPSKPVNPFKDDDKKIVDNTNHVREIPLNRPTPFTGDRSKVRMFMQQCMVYLQLNKRIYDTDEAKIAFILSYLTDKEALKWRETYLSSLVTLDSFGEFQYPTYKEFLETFQLYFKPINQTIEANNRLITLKQGKRTVEEYVAEFRLLISMAGITSTTDSDNIHLINYFRQGLNPAISKKIGLSENVPDTIGGWADRAVQYDTQYRLTMAMYGKTIVNYERSTRSTDTKDPNAMDVDAMTTEKRESLMRQGLCFKCEGRGHLARNCKGKKKDTPPQKRNVKDIHALLTALTAEEKEELLALQKVGTDEKKDVDF
jgi:hypothetical protein